MTPAIEHGLEASAAAPVRPPLRLTKAEPVEILAAAKRVAIKADWLLARWEEFSKTARACLTPDCLPEEMGLFMDVVRERFDVTTTPSFEASQWDHQPHEGHPD